MQADPNAGAMAELAPVRPDEQMDWSRLAAYLQAELGAQVPGLSGAMEVLQFPGGSANLTYLVRFGEQELVVRRPPLGPLAPGAHDMRREHRVLSRLYRAYPKAPRCYHLCEDESVMGARFIVSERRKGAVVRERFPDAMLHHQNLATRTSRALVGAMAELHNVVPAAVELEALGKPHGFARRQVAGWNERWHLAKERDSVEFDAVFEALSRTVPTPQRVSILHNDLKLDNCQFDPANPDEVTSVFDWDMATLGDPLVDLGTLLGYWPEPGDAMPRKVHALGPVDPYPTRAQLIAWYAEATGLDMSKAWWYEAFALWKTAVVVQQIYIRYKRGQTQDERFAGYADRVPLLLGQALPLVEGR